MNGFDCGCYVLAAAELILNHLKESAAEGSLPGAEAFADRITPAAVTVCPVEVPKESEAWAAMQFVRILTEHRKHSGTATLPFSASESPPLYPPQSTSLHRRRYGNAYWILFIRARLRASDRG